VFSRVSPSAKAIILISLFFLSLLRQKGIVSERPPELLFSHPVSPPSFPIREGPHPPGSRPAGVFFFFFFFHLGLFSRQQFYITPVPQVGTTTCAGKGFALPPSSLDLAAEMQSPCSEALLGAPHAFFMRDQKLPSALAFLSLARSISGRGP